MQSGNIEACKELCQMIIYIIIIARKEKKMTTKEVAEICGVSIPTVTGNAKKAGIVLENGKAHEWTEEELKKVQAQLMNNGFNRGNASTKEGIVEEQALSALKGGLTFQVIMQSGNIEACKELCQMITEGTKAQHDLLLAQEQNKLLLEQKNIAEANYQTEKAEHQKDKELVTHKYLTATQIKEAIRKEYGKNIVVSKAVKRIPLDDNDILYKPFRNENFTGQQPVYHPNVLDKIREILN